MENTMKLELKQLALYLPYKLKYANTKNEKINTFRSLSIDINMVDFGYGDAMELFEVKPILRPLSDLEEFSPAIWEYGIKKGKVNVNQIQYLEALVLFKNHFDLFGLIEKGLAIDINTLNQTKNA